MARIVALDFGTKRTGVAVSDTSETIAFGLDTISTDTLLDFLEKYHKEEGISKLVVGKPLQMSGEASDVEANILKTIKKLKHILPSIPIIRTDERFTSKIASQTINSLKLKKKKRRDKTLVDQISATLILQSHLNSPI